jgi:hypothetical protein
MKKSLAVLFLVFALALAANAQATTYLEDFEAAFPAWESGWLGTNSNLQNYYAVAGYGHAYRGNNPDGLWLTDGILGGSLVKINFLPAFGATLTSFAIDIAGYSPCTLFVYDKQDNIIFNRVVTLTYGAFTDPGVYAHYAVDSINGIGAFALLGSSVEGNTSIDNVMVSTNAVPVPPTVWLLGSGLLGLVGLRRKFKK